MKKIRTFAAAYHEAGHAVVGVALGIRFDSVWVAGSRGGIVPCRLADGSQVDWPKSFEMEVFDAAGAVAEARRSRRSIFNVSMSGGASDFRNIPDGKIDAAAQRAKDLLRQHWRVVESVADALMQCGILDESDVMEHFRGFENQTEANRKDSK